MSHLLDGCDQFRQYKVIDAIDSACAECDGGKPAGKRLLCDHCDMRQPFPPSFDFSPRITQASEPVRVQAFISQSPVVALCVGAAAACLVDRSLALTGASQNAEIEAGACHERQTIPRGVHPHGV